MAIKYKNRCYIKRIMFLLLGSFFLSVTPLLAEWDLGLEYQESTGNFKKKIGTATGLYADLYKRKDYNTYYNLCFGVVSYKRKKNDISDEIEQWYNFPFSAYRATFGFTYYFRDIRRSGFFVKSNAGILVKLQTLRVDGELRKTSKMGKVLSVGGGWDFRSISIISDYNLANDNWRWITIKLAYRFGRRK